MTGPWRDTRVIGITRQSHHQSDCKCEACGPLLLLALSEYEAERLRDALERRDGADSGDWHGQIRWKLERALRKPE